MKLTIKIFGLLTFLLVGQIVFAQTNKDKALAKAQEAMKLEDEGKTDEAIKLLEEAQKLDPDDMNYPYELGYAYYAMKDYKQASKYIEGILKHKDVNSRVYPLLGNCYDNLGKSDKAKETYETGLKKFPNSGNLYLEMGILQMGQEKYNKAMEYYEKGIEVDPKFASNYYWSAKLYCGSSEEVWGMIYGELFMNLERNSKRTAEISKLLYDTYKSQIVFSSDTSFSVSFSKNSTMHLEDLKDPSKMKLPFGVGTYEPTLIMSMMEEKAIEINSLDRIRKNFVETYFKNENDNKYPNILFDYQNKILKAGHMSAYNHWLLMKGDEDSFSSWKLAYNDKWADFVKWFNDNQIQIDDSHKFYRGQY